MRRRKLLAAVGLAVLVAAGVIVAWPRANRVTQENYDSIRMGMSRAEVEAILGTPGDHRTGASYTEPHISIGMPSAEDWFNVFAADSDPAWPVWKGDTMEIQVHFSDSGHATQKSRQTAHLWEQTSLDNLLWRAKRLWRR
jgi:hypothetical protein